jgi:predicted PurR-regulated permease PerM
MIVYNINVIENVIDFANIFGVPMSTELQQVLDSISQLKIDVDTRIDKLDTKIDNYNEKFDTYQKANQSVVNLAFTLIASATLVTIVSSIFKR